MLRLEEILAERVVGHGEQIRRIARILRRNAAGLGSRRPIGTFLLLPARPVWAKQRRPNGYRGGAVSL